MASRSARLSRAVTVSAPALLLLLLCAALPGPSAARHAHAGVHTGPRRGMLAEAPCCEDCQKQNSYPEIFKCFQNCQDCVSGQQCIDLSRDVAGAVAQVACSYAADQCTPQKAAAAFQATRDQCYRAAKNVCLTYGEDYAKSGGGSCAGYNSGVGNCDAATFRSYFNSKLNDLCESVGLGVAISLP
ncbi:hypothetical protein TSOC_007087 [Tetrabaena socialis]|uniref:Uncharacterized protein n=1 Tax=Tetrabaena socialis TaxID=47790 RepID=A0A2J8A1Y3_9CHLO|nr:hypothetical protein TSOC_007087 [Tetrabaena socialis]|eukprot:PNH06539.1 hypothetical protein TSOC_007087 [Tetrabaena socialis]